MFVHRRDPTEIDGRRRRLDRRRAARGRLRRDFLIGQCRRVRIGTVIRRRRRPCLVAGRERDHQVTSGLR